MDLQSHQYRDVEVEEVEFHTSIGTNNVTLYPGDTIVEFDDRYVMKIQAQKGFGWERREETVTQFKKDLVYVRRQKRTVQIPTVDLAVALRDQQASRSPSGTSARGSSGGAASQAPAPSTGAASQSD